LHKSLSDGGGDNDDIGHNVDAGASELNLKSEMALVPSGARNFFVQKQQLSTR
jgi:hypothetical protein